MKTRVISAIVAIIIGIVVIMQYYTILFDAAAFAVFAIAVSEIFTAYPGLDPETASTNSSSGAGLDWGSYPTMKKMLLGVNLTF